MSNFNFQFNTEIIDQKELLDTFFHEYSTFSDDEKVQISSAWDFLCSITANLRNNYGEPAFLHPMRVACILAESRLDAETVIAGILHNVLTIEGIEAEKLESKFGSVVVNIVRSWVRITGLSLHSKTLHEADVFRKMLFAMVDDIRVILVKLADRLDRIRNASALKTGEQKAVAQEIIEIWAPLANRLGMSAVKVEMEDLSLKFTNPDVFAQLKQLVTLKKNEREKYLEKAQKEIYKSASRAGLDIVVHTRAKHFYSIYQKMRKKNRMAEELLDLLAVRILCNTSADCYILIGLVHNLWKPLDGRFKDFIAMQKSNGYQSIHTTVMCETNPLEIQIRTHEMHAVAEFGVASHWLYKKGFSKDSVSIENLSIINNLKDLRKDHLDDIDFFNEIKDELLRDSVYVFTPNGDARELPAGATAIDFAYSIHTHIGETIVAAKADGKIIPLSRPLQNTQIIEILTNPQAHPTFNQLQLVKTARARSKIRSWLAANDPNFDTEKPQHPPAIDEKNALQQGQRGHKKGRGANPSNSHTHDDTSTDHDLPHNDKPVKIRIGDTTNFMINTAKCCKPRHGDNIVGYVSRGRGIIVHRADCHNFNKIRNIAGRIIAVAWEENPNSATLPHKAKSAKKH